MPRGGTTATIIVMAGLCGATGAAAHRARQRPLRSETATAPARDPAHPETGVQGPTGNAPFDNQIRKFTDPLNANGSK